MGCVSHFFGRLTIKQPHKSSNTEFCNDDLDDIQERFIVETVGAAFGLSRGGRTTKPSEEAWEWILSDKREVPFSFTQCCLKHGADPETMLDWLRWYKRKLLS